MSGLFVLVVLSAFIVWLLRGGRGRKTTPIAPEDDVVTPLDLEMLTQAERELAEDSEARSVDEAVDDDDWGPGTPRSP